MIYRTAVKHLFMTLVCACCLMGACEAVSNGLPIVALIIVALCIIIVRTPIDDDTDLNK